MREFQVVIAYSERQKKMRYVMNEVIVWLKYVLLCHLFFSLSLVCM